MLSRLQLEAIYNKHYEACFRYALSYVRSIEQAEDIVSEVFVKAYYKMEYVGDKEESFLIILTKNTCTDYERKKIEIYPLIDDLYLIADYVEDEIMKDAMLETIHESMNSLPRKCKKIFLLYMGGANTGDICSSMGISIQNALNQKTRAIKLIKQSIAKYHV